MITLNENSYKFAMFSIYLKWFKNYPVNKNRTPKCYPWYECITLHFLHTASSISLVVACFARDNIFRFWNALVPFFLHTIHQPRTAYSSSRRELENHHHHRSRWLFRVLNQNLSISVTRGLARAGRGRATHRRCSDDGRTNGDHQGSVFVQEVGRAANLARMRRRRRWVMHLI